MLRIDLLPLLCYTTPKAVIYLKKRILTMSSILVAIICVILILWQVFGFLLIKSNGSCSLVIDDNNRQKIEQLVFQNIEKDKTFPNINKAINIEWQSLMHKDQIVINYDKGEPFVFYITKRYENSLIEQIKNNGSVLYFQTKDFILDIAKTFLFSFILIFVIFFLIRQKRK